MHGPDADQIGKAESQGSSWGSSSLQQSLKAEVTQTVQGQLGRWFLGLTFHFIWSSMGWMGFFTVEKIICFTQSFNANGSVM